MKIDGASNRIKKFPRFDRKFFDSSEDYTAIGKGEIGGKAQGLVFISDILKTSIDHAKYSQLTISIPHFTVLTTDIFDAFMKRNDLYDIAFSDESDTRIANAFQKAELPAEYTGDLMSLVSKVKSPLAVRSSSLLEDAMFQPFAGVYGTKMIPNNQFQTAERFKRLIEAVKFVYASTFFKEAKTYVQRADESIRNEKMAVIIQEVVGQQFGDRYYPHISGVAKTYNYYPIGRSKPEDGVVNLALGLGKTIVDGGLSWVYSPAFPRLSPPFGNTAEFLKQTQNKFWAVNLGKQYIYDPIKESEYLVESDLNAAELDGTLKYAASTYDPQSDRIVIGTGMKGPRIITFSPVLVFKEFPLNEIIASLMETCENAVGAPVEIEFAVTLSRSKALPARFGFLQVRPMVISDEEVDLENGRRDPSRILAASDHVLGNGVVDDLNRIVYVNPDKFDKKYTKTIADELDEINAAMIRQNKPYLLIGFGRWGSSDPWLGIPVNWSQISGAKVIVEATLPDMNVDLSQGSHFFHNMSSFKISYFSVKHTQKTNLIDWKWLNRQKVVTETEFVKSIELEKPLKVMVDGRIGKGIIYHE